MRASCVGVRLGQHQQARALAHALDVLVHAEHVDAAVRPAVGLEALEAAARVVQHVRRRVHLDRPGRAISSALHWPSLKVAIAIWSARTLPKAGRAWGFVLMGRAPESRDAFEGVHQSSRG